MFTPSLFTGYLIAHGVLTIILIGILWAVCWHYLMGTTAPLHAALLLLGVGWNFMFIETTTLLTRYAVG